MTNYSIKRIYAAVAMAEEAALAIQRGDDSRNYKERLSDMMNYIHSASKNPSIIRKHEECRMNMNSLAWAKGYASNSMLSPYVQNLLMLDGMMFQVNRFAETKIFGDPTFPLLLKEVKISLEKIFKHESEFTELCKSQ